MAESSTFNVGTNVTVVVDMQDDGWDEVVKEVVTEVCVPMMQNLADICNRESGLEGGGEKILPDGTKRKKDQAPGYRAGNQGGKPLAKHDFRATCITATNSAAADNALTNRLVANFFRVGGG